MSGTGTELRVTDLAAGYGRTPVVRDLSFTLEPGTVMALLGPNGAGKTTTLLALAGLLPHQGGTVELGGQPIPSGDAVAANRLGIALVPDDRALFPSLTVEEHLELACRRGDSTPRRFLDVFPALEKRWQLPAGALSGGEQQMLAVARGLAQQPRILLIDEMSMGLAPVIVESLLPIVRQVATEHDTAVVLVEQHVTLALDMADRAMVMVHGDVMLAGPADELARDTTALEQAYLG